MEKETRRQTAREAALRGGISGLFETPAPTRKARQEEERTAESEGRKNYKAVCYTLPQDLIQDIRYIAYYDRKKINEVIIEALEDYKSHWKATTEKARELQ